MMSAQRWRRRLPRLLVRPSAQRSPPLVGCAMANAPPFSSCWISRLTLILLAFLERGDDVLALHGSSFCLANLARGLRVHFTGRLTLDGRAARVPSRFVPQRASRMGCQMCAMSAVIV